MIPDLPYVHFARVTLENTTPLSIGTGRGDGLQDTLIVLDANGLPALPGSSVAGVLRHLSEDCFHDEAAATNRLFGFAGKTSQASRLEVSWGHIHSRDNIPVDGLLNKDICDDPILKPLLKQPLPMRDGVRIDHRGVASDEGKFDRSYLPPGYRFSFDVTLWDEAASADWAKLLGLINSPLFRLGGATRRGFGAFNVVSLRGGEFDLRKDNDLKHYSAITASLAQSAQALKGIPTQAAKQTWHEITIPLTAEDGGFRFGSGGTSLGNPSSKAADALPLSEQRIEWKKDRAQIVPRRAVVIPASGVKGALAHRIAFHYNRLEGKFENDATVGEDNPAVRELFGYAKDKKDSRAGKIWMDDIYLAVPKNVVKTQMHNSIDRFTGGVRGGALFSEEIVHAQSFELKLCIAGARFERNVLEALKLGLHDLTEGRLALGASSAKGHGYFEGKFDWPAAWSAGEGRA